MIEKYLSGGMCGYDREGSPIWYDVIGPVDPKGLFLSASKQDFIKSKIRDCEVLQKECNLQSQRVRAQTTENPVVLVTLDAKMCLGLTCSGVYRSGGTVTCLSQSSKNESVTRVHPDKPPRAPHKGLRD